MGLRVLLGFLGIVAISCAGPSATGTAPVTGDGDVGGQAAAVSLVQPGDVVYLGAFRLPGGDDRPRTFAYGGNAMTFNPDGDPSGAGDGFPGSLFVMGHDRLAYGEMPDGGQVAEVGIPVPVASRDLQALGVAEMLQDFHEVTGGLFDGLDEIQRSAMQYLTVPGLGPRIHIAWGQHFQEERRPSHALFSPVLATPDPQGAWYIGSESLYSVNGYMFEIPSDWASAHVGGQVLATGRYRDGGWSGQGPALFSYVPWTDSGGSLAAPGSALAYTTLLRYRSSQDSEDVVSQSLSGYQHADEWEGGEWLTTPSGKSAVVFAGTKGVGDKYWYGWVNPAGPELPCIETELLGQYTLCRLANGDPCSDSDLGGCSGHNDYRGWWSSRFEAQLIFYDPDQLAQVASGGLAPHDPQPYAVLSLDPYLLLQPPGWEVEALGPGAQRRARIGDAAYDRTNGFLYVLELFGDEAKPLVHVFQVQ
jgi:hypothetical protein